MRHHLFTTSPTRRRGGSAAGWGVVLLAFAALVLGLHTLSRVGRVEAPAGKMRVEVWGWDIAAKSLDSLTESFEAEHPTIDVEVKPSGANMQSRFLLSLAAGQGVPEISQLQERDAPKFTGIDRMLDLTPTIARYADAFAPAFMASCYDQGKIRAVPWDVGPCAVYYKRWIFEKYDLDPNTIETWDDYIAMGKQLLERSGGRVKMLPLATSALVDPFQMLMQQCGGGPFDAQGRMTLHSRANLEALGVLRRILDAGIASSVSSGPEILGSFSADNIATYPGAVWMMHGIKQSAGNTAGRWGVFRLPAIRPGGLRTSNLGGSVLVVPAQSLHPQEAALFVEHALCNVESQMHQFRKFGLFPAYLPTYQHPQFDVPDPFFGGQHVNALFAQDIDRIPPMPRTRDWSEVERYLRQTLTAWAERRQDSDAYLADAAKRLGGRLGREVVRP